MEDKNKNKSHQILKFSWVFKKAYEKTLMPVVKELQLTQNEASVLLFLYNNAPMDTAKDIVDYRCISKSLVSKSVDSLIKKGYLKATESLNDRRIMHLTIESPGLAVACRLNKVQNEFYELMVNNISLQEFEVMKKAMEKIYKNIINKI